MLQNDWYQVPGTVLYQVPVPGTWYLFVSTGKIYEQLTMVKLKKVTFEKLLVLKSVNPVLAIESKIQG